MMRARRAAEILCEASTFPSYRDLTSVNLTGNLSIALVTRTGERSRPMWVSPGLPRTALPFEADVGVT